MTKLERVTNGLVIVVCCVSLFMLIESRFKQTAREKAMTPPDPVGRLVTLAGVDWHAAPITVLLQLSSTCHYCNDSMPFYQQLAAIRKGQFSQTALIVSSQDSVPTREDHLAKQHVAVDKIVHARLDSI